MEKEKGKGNCVGMLGNKKSFVSLTYARRRSFQKRSALPLLIIGCFFWSITQTRSPMIHFPVNLFSANGERPVRTTFHFWFRLYSSQGIVLWDTCHLAPADGSLQRLTRKMLSCSLLFSDPFFLLNTLHYSLIFRFVKQFFKKYHVFSPENRKNLFLDTENQNFYNRRKSAEPEGFCGKVVFLYGVL